MTSDLFGEEPSRTSPFAKGVRNSVSAEAVSASVPLAERIRSISIALYEAAYDIAAAKGILIADSDLGDLLHRMEHYVPHKTIFAMKADDL